MAEPFQFDWTTAVPVEDEEPQSVAPSAPTPPESVDAVLSDTPFGAQNTPLPQQGPVNTYAEFDWKTAEPLDGGFDASTARETTPAEEAEFYDKLNSTDYLPTKDEWKWLTNYRKQRDDNVSKFLNAAGAMGGSLLQMAAATAYAPFDILVRGTKAYDEWVNSSAEGVRQIGITNAELWSWAGDIIGDRGREIDRNAALDSKLRQQLASENKFTGNQDADAQIFLQAKQAAKASGFYDKTQDELAEDEATQYQRFIRDRSFDQQRENITETNIGTVPDGRAEMGIDPTKINPGLVTLTEFTADPVQIAAGGLGFVSKIGPLRRVAALTGKPLELGAKAAGWAAIKADALHAGIVEGIERSTGLNGAQQMAALQNPITWKAAVAMGTLKKAGNILRTSQNLMDTGSVFVREARMGGVGVSRVEAAGKLRNASIPERYRRAYDGFFTGADSTLRRVSETPGLSPIARRSAATLDRLGATQAFRVADDAIGGALATAPIAVPMAIITPEDKRPELFGSLATIGALGGVAGGKFRRSAEMEDALVAKMLADVETSGGDAVSMANMLSHDKLARMAGMQSVMSAKSDFVPLRAKDYELNTTVKEHMGQGSRGFYVDATKGQRPQVFVNLDKLATGDVVGHEIGHAILKSDILGGKIKQGMRAMVDAQYGADGLAARGREYVKAQLTQEVNHKATGINIDALTPEESQRKAAGVSMDDIVADRWKNDEAWRDQQINERVDLLNQEALGKGEMSFDWARDEIAAETFSGLGNGINISGLRASGPIGRTLGAFRTTMETMGAKFNGNGRLETPNRLFTENPLFDTPQMRKAVNNYVRLYDRYLVGLEKEAKTKQRGRPIAPTGRPEEAARSPHTRVYQNGNVIESDLFIQRPDGTLVLKSQQMLNTQEKARAATLKSINNRTRFVDENSNEWGARKLANGRIEVGGPTLPLHFDHFVQIPQWLRTKARDFEAGRADGRSYLYSYNAIGTGESGSYRIKNLGNVEAKTGEAVPFGWAVSTKHHLLAKVIDLNSFRAATMRAIDKGQLGEFGNNLREVEAGLKQLMKNHEDGVPGETGLGVTKKNILNGLLGTGTVTQRLNNQAWHTLNNQGSIRTFRFDRFNYAEPYDTGYFPHYQKININALPDEAGRMSVDDWMSFDADRQKAWLNKRAAERGYTNATNWANSDEAGFAAASDEYRKLFPRPDNNNRMPQALPREAMGMPDVPANLSTDQILRELEENQGYLGLSTLGMREGRPVRGGAQRTRELLRRNEELNAELRGRGGTQEESDVERVLRQRGQAMPDAQVTDDGLVRVPENAPTFTLPRRAMAQFMPDTGVDLADYADRTILALPADRMGIGSMMVGPKGKEREVSVKGQGGAGFMEIYNGGGWAFSDEATGNRFMKRLREAAEPGEASVLVGITAMSEFNHLKNQTGQLAYVEALEAAIAGKSISRKQADVHIKAISQSIVQSTAKSVTDSTRRKFAAIKNFNDFAKAVRNKSLNFADAAPYSVQIARRALPIPYKEAKDIGIAFDDIGKQTADPRYADVPFGTVVALLEVPLDQAPVRSDFHYSYPFKVAGRSIGFLKQYYDVGQLTSDPRIRNSAGAVQAQPLQTVLPKLDRARNVTRGQAMPDVVESQIVTIPDAKFPNEVAPREYHVIGSTNDADGNLIRDFATLTARMKERSSESKDRVYGKKFMLIIDGEQHEFQTAQAATKWLQDAGIQSGATARLFRNGNNQIAVSFDESLDAATERAVRASVANNQVRELSQSELPPNTALLNLVNNNGRVTGVVGLPYDGTPEGLIAAHAKLERQVAKNYKWREQYTRSMSQRGGTDAEGRPAFVVSANLKNVAAVGTPQARYILGDLDADPGPAPAPQERAALPAPKGPKQDPATMTAAAINRELDDLMMQEGKLKPSQKARERELKKEVKMRAGDAGRIPPLPYPEYQPRKRLES